MQFGLLFRVPRLTVKDNTVTNFYKHELDSPVTVSQFLAFAHVPGANTIRIDASQSIAFNNTVPVTPGAGTEGTYNVFQTLAGFTAASLNFTDEQLVALGVLDRVGQPRLINTGATTSINADLANYLIVPRAVNVLEGSYDPDRLMIGGLKATGSPPENTELFVQPSGLEVITAPTFNLNVSFWTTASIANVGFPNNRVPFIDSTATTSYNIKPLDVNPISLSQGVLIKRISTDVFAFKFAVEFKENVEVQMDGGNALIDDVEVVDYVGASVPHGLNDRQMSWESLNHRRQIIMQTTWNDIQPVGAVLLSLRIPQDLLVSETVAASYKTMTYSSHTYVDVTLTLQSNPFQAGALVAYSVPLTDQSEIARTHENSLTSQTILPEHTLIMAGGQKSVTLRIPWRYPKRVMDLDLSDSEPNLAVYQVSVFSPLAVGVEATNLSASIVISAEIVGADFSVPRIAASTNFSAIARGRVKGLVTRPVTVHDVNMFEAQGLMDLLGGAVKDLVHKAVDFGTAKLGSVIKGFIPDYPNNAMQPQSKLVTFHGRYANVEGLGCAEPLDDGIGEQYVALNMPVTAPELNISSLMARPSYLGRFAISADTTQIGSIVWSTELSPSTRVTAAQPGANFQPTLVEMIALMGTFWRGDLCYTFVPVFANMHSIDLAFVPNYGRYVAPTMDDEQYSSFVTIKKVQGGQPFSITVPWKSATDHLRVAKGFNSDRSSYSYGSFYIRTLTKLQAPEVLTQSVEVLVFVSMKGAELKGFCSGPLDYRIAT
jgi:hypothetical protein